MNVIFPALLIMFFALAAAPPAVAQGRKTFSRPTLVAAPCEGEPKWHVKVYEDEDYQFVYRHYGKAEHVPGFFVRDKRRGRWVEITKLSTENAKLGQSPPLEEALLSVSWDYRRLEDVDYAELPLRTSGSINFPGEAEYDAGGDAYRLNFNPSLKTEYQTWFWVLKKDLEAAFGS